MGCAHPPIWRQHRRWPESLGVDRSRRPERDSRRRRSIASNTRGRKGASAGMTSSPIFASAVTSPRATLSVSAAMAAAASLAPVRAGRAICRGRSLRGGRSGPGTVATPSHRPPVPARWPSGSGPQAFPVEKRLSRERGFVARAVRPASVPFQEGTPCVFGTLFRGVSAIGLASAFRHVVSPQSGAVQY